MQECKNINYFRYDAEAYCQNLGGHLASFRSSAASITRILSLQNSYQYASDYSFWFGLTRLDKEKGYQYSDNSAVSFTNWDLQEPNDHYGREDCVDLRTSGRWKDSFCYLNQGWMCSIPKVNIILDTCNWTGIEILKFKKGIEPNNTFYKPTSFESKNYFRYSQVNYLIFNLIFLKSLNARITQITIGHFIKINVTT